MHMQLATDLTKVEQSKDDVYNPWFLLARNYTHYTELIILEMSCYYDVFFSCKGKTFFYLW